MNLSSPRLRFTGIWRSMRLSARLALGFGALMGLMLLVVLLAVLQFAQLGNNSARMMNHDLQRLLQVQELRQYADSHGNAMARLLTAPRLDRDSIYPMIDAENDPGSGETAQAAE